MMIVENTCINGLQLYNMNYAYLRRTYLNIFPMVQVEPNMYLLDLSSSSEESLVRLDESEISSRSTRDISSRCQNIRRKFHKCMECFLDEGGSCSYDDEIIENIEVPLTYKNLVKQWVPKDIPELNTYF